MDPGQFLSALLAIIVIDIVLAGDNAIVIALAARSLPGHLQKRAIVWGAIGAIGVRSLMTVIVVWLLKMPGLLLAGVSGNLNDRLTREPGPFHGHVIDFLQVPWFAVFNVADIWITFAAVTVIWLTMITQVNLAGERVDRPEKADSKPSGDDTGTPAS